MRKLITKIVSVLLITSMTITGLTACGGSTPPEQTEEPHVCVFETTLSHNSQKHYYKCVSADCNKISGEASHLWFEGVITTYPTKTKDGNKEFHCDCGEKKNVSIQLTAPTPVEVYTARQAVVQDSYEGYDFKFELKGDISVLGYEASANGVYDGKYRLNKTTGQETYARKSSGKLFYDSNVYSYTANTQKIQLVCDDETNAVKKSSILRIQDEEGFFINKAVSGLVDIIEASDISDVKIASTTIPYDFVAVLNFGSNNPKISKITNMVAKLGTTIAIKNFELTNPTALPFYFTLDRAGKLQDFKLEFGARIKIKGASLGITLTYEQKGANSEIIVPTTNDILVGNDVLNELNLINTSLTSIKADEDYSLEVFANNEFDPAWHVSATIDHYKALLYKNTDNENVWFNHSYEYKSHTEEDGAEKYAFTIGNVQEGGTYIIKRKGGNTNELLENVTIDTQFDYLVNPFLFSVEDIDCIRKAVDKNKTTYKLYLSNASAIAVQDKIIDIVNSNEEAGVLDVDNYMSSNVTIKDAEFIVEIVDGEIVSMKIKTDLKYNPTAGDYTDYNITLTNELEILVNKKLDKASDYEAPEKVVGSFLNVGLNNVKYYIL